MEDSPKKTPLRKSEEKKDTKTPESSRLQELDKKFVKRKEDGSVRGKSDTEDELKDLQKKVIIELISYYRLSLLGRVKFQPYYYLRDR